MSDLIERVAIALRGAIASKGPHSSDRTIDERFLARVAIEAMRDLIYEHIEQAAEALHDYECRHLLNDVVKWEMLNEKIKQHFRGKVRVVVDAVGEA